MDTKFFLGGGGGGLVGFRNDISYKGHHAKGSEKQQREGCHKIEKMGRRRLWMDP